MSVHALWAGFEAGRWLAGKVFGESGDDVRYTTTAVPVGDLPGWRRTHHPALPYAEFAAVLRKHGFAAAKIRECLETGERLERANPGHRAYCWNIREA